jgi:nicotinamide-nucleotide amidase
MAEGAQTRLGSDHALAVTGIAGPGGGSAEKPVGTVWLAHASAGGTLTRSLQLPGDRQQNRIWAVASALDLLRQGLGDGRLDL